MFNWLGNHKIGVLGSANSGKTIFLTSLLWHLSQHDSEHFNVGANVSISDFKMKKRRDHNFNFSLHKNTFVQRHGWPDKTSDFAVASCSYSRSDSTFDRQIDFVDIPGERISDILIWTSKSYGEWVERLCEFWQENPRIWEIMERYWGKVQDMTIGMEALAVEYKMVLWAMLDYYCPITPSTYYLGTDGQMLGDEKNSDRREAIYGRPIWSGGELLPISVEWKTCRAEEYAEQEKRFKAYKREVLKPLFDEVDDCDHFVFCVDILNMLMSGPELLLQNQREFKDFIQHLQPAKFFQFINRLGKNPPRLAIVATKADMVTSRNKDRLQYLLKDFAASFPISGIHFKHFICSSCVSTQEMEDAKGKRTLVGNSVDNPEQTVELDLELPEYWPDTWDGGDYALPEVAPRLSAMRPPEQINLDQVFQFIVEDK